MDYTAWQPERPPTVDPTTMVTQLVHGFYAKVRRDPLIGPIFNGAIGDHWPAHLATLVDFWLTMGMGIKGYEGRPLATHLRLTGLTERHFDRWLGLFRATAHEMLPSPLALHFIQRAETIAKSFQAAIAVQNDFLAQAEQQAGQHRHSGEAQ